MFHFKDSRIQEILTNLKTIEDIYNSLQKEVVSTPVADTSLADLAKESYLEQLPTGEYLL